jgi:PAP2 superfamily
LRIDDTVGLSSGHDGGSFLGIRFDPYGAMPSMHVGWGLLVAIVCFGAASSWWLRAALVAHPLLMTVAVTATGNHYFLDSAAGAAAALLALATVEGLLALRRRAFPAAATARPEVRRPAAVPAWAPERDRRAA